MPNSKDMYMTTLDHLSPSPYHHDHHDHHDHNHGLSGPWPPSLGLLMMSPNLSFNHIDKGRSDKDDEEDDHIDKGHIENIDNGGK